MTSGDSELSFTFCKVLSAPACLFCCWLTKQMDVLAVCAELSAINLIALDSTVGAVKLAVEYKINIKVSVEKIMAIQILHYYHSPIYLQAEEVTFLFYVLCCICKVMCATIKPKSLTQHPL